MNPSGTSEISLKLTVCIIDTNALILISLVQIHVRQLHHLNHEQLTGRLPLQPQYYYPSLLYFRKVGKKGFSVFKTAWLSISLS